MEFNTKPTHAPPKNLFPCLATITISGSQPAERTRRPSAGGAAPEEGNVLQRVISGGRRKSSFGDTSGNAGFLERRRSITNAGPVEEGTGKWYWRVQVGVSDTHLILLPLSQPANSLLTSPPPPLSAAMPAHSTETAAGSHTSHPPQEGEHTGIADKIKHFLHLDTASHTNTNTNTNPNTATTPTTAGMEDSVSSATTAVEPQSQTQGVDRILDQTASGGQLPSPEANAAGATNVNANAEMGWPGMINGEKLGEIVVDLRGVEKDKVHLGGGKRGEGMVTIPVTAYFTNLVQGMIEPVGNNHHNYPKSGTIKFEFDKHWIGAKGEAELLHFYITQAITDLPTKTHDNPTGGERAIPQNTEFRIGSGQAPTRAEQDVPPL